MGKENVEKQKEVEDLKEQLAGSQSKLESDESNKNSATQKFDNFCINHAKVIKDALRSSGTNKYNNYDKSSFKINATDMLDSGSGDIHRLTDSEREKLHSQRNATLKPKVDTLIFKIPDSESITDRLLELLKTTVVSETIESLKAEPELAKWVRQGLALHQGQSAELCRFCEQPLPKGRLTALEAHFNDQYERLIQRIDQKINELKAMSRDSENPDMPDEARLYDDCQQEFQAAKVQLTNDLHSTKDFLDTAARTLENKKSKVFEATRLNIEAPLVKTGAVENLNAVIRKHNQASDNLETRRKEVRERLANDMIAESLEEFSELRKAVDTAKDVVQDEKKNIQSLNTEINKLERQIIEHRRPAEELNENLRNYLGHNELRLEIKETGYAVTRGTEPADSLSEGETTAIALLYFLKSLKDKGFNLENGIVVLDDPVSSLDANALFFAFSFIRERTEGAGQLFILTHNFSLLRQVRNWFHYLKKTCFFMLESSFKDLDKEHYSAMVRLAEQAHSGTTGDET